MKVADILRIKGSVVKTVPPHKRRFYFRAMRAGKLVRGCDGDGNSIEGIVSERDLAYGHVDDVDRLPQRSHSSELMTTVVCCLLTEDSVD